VPHLVVTPADGPTEYFALGAERATLGRASECDLILPDVVLSRRHAELVRSSRGWSLRDLGSLNGTRLNGVRVAGEQRLHDGDVIAMSDWKLVFREGDAPPAAPHPDAGARLRDITDLATRSDVDLSALARQSRVLGVLTRAAASLVSLPSAPALLDALLGHLLDAVPAHRGLVVLFEKAGPKPLAARALSGSPPAALDPAVAERIQRSQTGFLAPRVTGADGSVCSMLCAPLWSGGEGPAGYRLAGCVALEGSSDPSPFGEEHLRLATAVANLAASRLESLRLSEENADKRLLDEDVKGAARIQASLLPDDTPAVPGFELAGSSRLCSAVGADYYDFSWDEGGLLVALGDVAGKGLAAALLMAALRAAVRALWRERRPLGEIVGGINENLCQTIPKNRYATLFLARLDTSGGGITWVNAGHAPAVLVRAAGRHASLEEGGTILGVFPGDAFREGRTVMEKGDVLVLLSDGVVEAARAASSDLDPERVAGIVRAATGTGDAASMLAALQAAADERSKGPRADDHTFVVVRRLD
jgi:sigma-B regulation protein RsbU (phosphoserine phosphatase)